MNFSVRVNHHKSRTKFKDSVITLQNVVRKINKVGTGDSSKVGKDNRLYMTRNSWYISKLIRFPPPISPRKLHKREKNKSRLNYKEPKVKPSNNLLYARSQLLGMLRITIKLSNLKLMKISDAKGNQRFACAD